MSNASKNEEARNIARRFIRVLDIQDGQVIVIKRDDEVSNLDLFNGLRRALGSSGRTNCIVVMARELEEVTTLSDQEMEELGWVRKVEDDKLDG